MKNTLVIGYGNELRSDDGVGYQIATVVEDWNLPHVQVIASHQLTPEMADALAGAERAIFVDAGYDSSSEGVQARALEPAKCASDMGHFGDPRALLALTEALYGYWPSSWLITVPAENFDFGWTLSRTAREGASAALTEIRQLVER